MSENNQLPEGLAHYIPDNGKPDHFMPDDSTEVGFPCNACAFWIMPDLKCKGCAHYAG